MSNYIEAELPTATTADIHLSHPSDAETQTIWKLISVAWKDALTLPLFLEESAYLTTAPLAADGGNTQWVLVPKNAAVDKRPILASCETFRKRCWMSDSRGNVTDAVVHGIASVYCNPKYRGRGYASRLMRELAAKLPNWQSNDEKVIGSILYSDIGKQFYSDLGWKPFPSFQVEFDSSHGDFENSLEAQPIMTADLAQLCEVDCVLSKQWLTGSSEVATRFMVVPDQDHMRWHHAKEEFGAGKLLGKVPDVQGAIAGHHVGQRIWVVWTHRFYGPPDQETSDNTLYILRLVIEDSPFASHPDEKERVRQAQQLRAVLQAALLEASNWKLKRVKLWNPSIPIRGLLEQTGIPFVYKERETDSIPSVRWSFPQDQEAGTVEWVGNEKYAWC